MHAWFLANREPKMRLKGLQSCTGLHLESDLSPCKDCNKGLEMVRRFEKNFGPYTPPQPRIADIKLTIREVRAVYWSSFPNTVQHKMAVAGIPN